MRITIYGAGRTLEISNASYTRGHCGRCSAVSRDDPRACRVRERTGPGGCDRGRPAARGLRSEPALRGVDRRVVWSAGRLCGLLSYVFYLVGATKFVR